MTTFALLSLAATFLAGVNGANDNFKGVATLHGSGVLGYRAALTLATLATVAGSLAALWLARGLLATFSGKGLVPDAVAASPEFLAAVAISAGATVFLATRLGLPISTTHALTGALVGAGLVHAGAAVDVARLGSSFLAPLLLSPLAAAAIGVSCASAFRAGGRLLRVEADTCVCVGEEIVAIGGLGGAAAATASPAFVVDRREACTARFHGSFLGVDLARAVDRSHLVSGAAVSFARGLNDTPKIAALLSLVPFLSATSGIVLVAAAMAAGGLLVAFRVAHTMSHRITAMEKSEGFAGNLATAALVFAASWAALPVSTTHVSCGSLFGIGVLSGRTRWRTVGEILAAWVTTLPLAALLGASAALFMAAPVLAAAGGEAPPIRAATWINHESSAAPEYGDAVTLVEFWTFACWNCKNVEPHVKSWHERFAAKGLRVIGVHTPELAHERVVENVRRYAAERGIGYPIAIDNDFAIWKSFGNRAWPTWYLIDRSGRVRYAHEGEGAYAETEAEIEKLLAEK